MATFKFWLGKLWPWFGTAACWLLDRLFGDSIFAWIKPMIPDAIPQDVARALLTYGPPTGFLIVAVLLVFMQTRSKNVNAMTNTKTPFIDQSINAPNNSGSISQNVTNNWNVSVDPQITLVRDLTKTSQQSDGVQFELLFRLSHPGRVSVAATSPSLSGLRVFSWQGGQIASGARQNGQREIGQNARREVADFLAGEYLVVISTVSEDEPQVRVEVVR